jgi:hypothetical protein
MSAIRGAVAERASFQTTVLRETKRVRLSVPPIPPDSDTLGVELTQQAGSMLRRVQLSPSESARAAVTTVGREASAIFKGLKQALQALLLPTDSSRPAGLQGPIGIARMGGDIAATDALRLLEFGTL